MNTPKVLDNQYMSRSSPRVMKFMSILNAFNINDHKTLSNKEDEIYLYIYSDVIGSLFKCGTYSFQSGDFLDLNMLKVPCDE